MDGGCIYTCMRLCAVYGMLVYWLHEIMQPVSVQTGLKMTMSFLRGEI